VQVSDLGTQWNDFYLSFDTELPEDSAGIAELLSRTIVELQSEIAPSRRATLERLGDDWRLNLDTGEVTESAYLAIANQSPRFGHLGRAVQRIGVRSASHKLSAIVVRSDDFPKNPNTEIAKIIGGFIAQGGRTVVIRDQEMGVMLAYFEFAKRYGSSAHFAQWRSNERPLASLPGIQALLRIDGLPEPSLQQNTKAPPVHVPSPVPVAPEVKPRPEPRIAAPALSAPIELGTKSDRSVLTVQARELTRHAAILGGAGSGKTTLAFRLIEQLLARGVHAVLVDRKGDLAAYAEPRSWQAEVDEATRTRREWLRSRVDIRFFTPGAKDGRDLSIPTLPAGLDGLGAGDAEQEARDAADGLAAMLEWGKAKAAMLAVLKQAITTLGTLRPRERSGLSTLVDFISSYPPELLAAIGKLDRKLLDKVVADVETLRINEGRLFDGDAEQLDVAQMLGPSDGKTRLTIISTKFLGSLPTQLFWIARFLSEVGRYASRNPKPTLQAIVFLDEADMYLPAISKPATKPPLENLIRRARSAGIGIFLATQSPADLDYKSRENITTWLVGRVSQERAIEKLRPVFGNNGRAADELPALTVGNFFAVDEQGVRRFAATLPCIMPIQLEEARLLELARM
jgi:DNA helicase HerA-like ATPase